MDAARLGARCAFLLLAPSPGAAFRGVLASLEGLLPPAALRPDALARLLVQEPGFADAAAVAAARAALAPLFPGRDAGAMLAADASLLASATPPAPRRDPNDEYYV